jgi:hypothetical protein
MSAIHAWALAAGAAALGLPIVIHLLTRARGRTLVYPTYRFVQEAAAERRKVSRLRDILVLLLRTLAVAALAAGFARLLLKAPEAAAAPTPEGGRWAVLVLDSSQSMNAQADGVDPFALAQREARTILQRSEIKRAEVLIAGQRPRAIFGSLSVNLAGLRQEVDKARVLPEAFDPSAALAEAAALVKGLSDDERRGGEVVVLTDLQRSNWATASFASVPADLPVRIVDVRQGLKTPGNAAILRVWSSGLPTVGRPMLIGMELANYGPEPLARDLEFVLEDQSFRRSIALAPGVRREESFVLTPARGGPQVGTARLAGGRDALPEDDVRPVAVLVRDECRIALVTSTPVGQVGSAAYFLDRALAASGETGFKIEVVKPGRLEGDLDPGVARADLLVLVEPGRLSRSAVETVSRLLSRGLPVFFALQKPADADVVAELESVLGPAMSLPVGFVPLDRTAASRFIVWADPSRRPFRIFGAGFDRFTRDLVLAGGLRTSPRGRDEEESVRARLSDTSAAFVLVPAQLGRLALLNLPLSGPQHAGRSALLVPLIQEIALDLLEGPTRGGGRSAIAGRAYSLPLPAHRTRDAALSTWRIVNDEGKPADGPRLVEDKGGPVVLWSPAERPGSYRVMNGDRVEEAFTVGLPPEESDLARIDPKVLEERIARGRPVRVTGAESANPDPRKDRELWPWFVGTALLCFFLELAVLKAFRT